MLTRTLIRSSLQLLVVSLLSMHFLSCASVLSSARQAPHSKVMIPAFQHEQSEKTSDCIVACADMVLNHYGIDQALPDSAYPINMIDLSNGLNSGKPIDEAGHILFSAVLGMTVSDIIVQLECNRPLIIAYRVSGINEYHSVVVTGAETSGKRFYISDPARSKPVWKRVSKLPTFSTSGLFLVMVIGLQEG